MTGKINLSNIPWWFKEVEEVEEVERRLHEEVRQCRIDLGWRGYIL